MADTILITGGAGNLACQLSYDLVARGHRVVLTDLAEQPSLQCDSDCDYRPADIRCVDQVRQVVTDTRPDVIIHFASLLSGSSEADRELAWDVNLNGAFYVFEAALACGTRQVVFPSSVASFGRPLPALVPDDFPQWPTGLYGVTKVAVERLGYYYHRHHGLDFRCLRVPIVVSPYANRGAASSYASLAFLHSSRGEEFVFQVRRESSPVLIYLKDVLRAVLLLMDAPARQLTRRVYNLPGISPTAAELADAIWMRVPQARLIFQPDPLVADLIDSWPRAFDERPSREDWGWHVEFQLDQMADDLMKQLSTDRR